MAEKDPTSECACQECVGGCANGTPGWFLPGEPEQAAALLGITVDELRAKYLIQDYWCGDGVDGVRVWTPIKTGPKMDRANEFRLELDLPPDAPGQVASFGYGFISGRCVFLDENNRCRIHDAKPYECAVTKGCDEQTYDRTRRRRIAEAWAQAEEPVSGEDQR